MSAPALRRRSLDRVEERVERAQRGPLGFAGVLVFAVLFFLWAPGPASALELDPIDTSPFTQPVFVTSDPDDPDRLFVVEKGGTIVLVDHGTRRQFLDISDLVLNDGEQGLLSMAFDPGYATNGRFYVYYVTKAPAGTEGDLRIAEFRADASGDEAATSTFREIITISHPINGNHNGGQLQIGPDGYLYIATGDGGGGNDPDENAQNLNSLLGKILRIDPDPPAGGGAEYSIPSDNPFVGIAGRDEIWSYGLRNPWRFSFDRLTGALVIGDVGQGAWEEIDYVQQPPAGTGGRAADFGWDCREGAHVFEAAGCPASGFTDPVFEYPHDGRCSITGGYISRDPGIPDYAGRYLYGDLCAGPVRSLIPGDGSVGGATDDRAEAIAVASPTSFGEDSCGRMYIASFGGTVARIQGATPTDCTPPDTVIDSGPAQGATITTDEATFSFRGDPAGDTAKFGCKLDSEPFADCSSPKTFSSLADGSHTVSFRAEDATGNQDPTPATRTFTVDTAPPPPPPPPPPPDAGPCAPSTRLGNEGSNELIGGPGRDALTGAGGSDRLVGVGAADCLAGGRDADELLGGSGGDRIFTGPDRDEVDSGRGPDKVFANDGVRDTIDCGRGRRDTVIADDSDRVDESCESVRRK